MATKNCPKCSKQVPVACKKCLCGHIFFLTRRGASSSSTSPAAASKSTATASTSSGANEGIKLEDFGDGDQPRRSGRVQREKTKFYDALQYENQTRKEAQKPIDIQELLSVSDPNPFVETESEFLDDVDVENLEPPSTDQIFERILLTVGTTSFDALVDILCESETMNQLRDWRTKRVRVQIGASSSYVPGEDMINSIFFEFFDFKDTLAADIKWADLVISHAGAGTALDVLDRSKTLIVIPNESLMENHQVELANHLKTEQYAYSATFETYHEVLKTIRKGHLRQFPPKNPVAFEGFLETVMNFDPEKAKKAKEDFDVKEKKRQAEAAAASAVQENFVKRDNRQPRKNRFTM